MEKQKYYIKAQVKIELFSIHKEYNIKHGNSQLFTKPYTTYQETIYLKQAVDNVMKNFKGYPFQLLDYKIILFIKCDNCKNESIYKDTEMNLCEKCLLKYNEQRKLYNHIKTNEIYGKMARPIGIKK